MIRVLQINVGSENFGGVSSLLLNIYRNIDRTKIQFDFLTPNISTYNMYRKEIEEYGGHIYDFHINIETLVGKFRYALALRRFLKHHSYNIVHINSGSLFFNCITTITAKSVRKGIKIIVHSHNNNHRSWWKRVMGIPLKWIMEVLAQSLLACSEEAAKNMFLGRTVRKGTVMIVKNGIPVEKFAYNEEERNLVRRELNIENYFVIGHVGRFVQQKNHDFLIDVFGEIYKHNDQAVLLLVGQGDLEDDIKEKVRVMRLTDKVIFLGQRNDTDKIYQAMDVFCLPSLYEGFPVSIIEAQASGLPCVVSEAVTEETNICGIVHRLGLNESFQAWADYILQFKNNSRKDRSGQLLQRGFDIKKTVEQLSNLYFSLIAN